MTISEGIFRQGQNTKFAMPAFTNQLNPAQITVVSQYVRQHFAGITTPITADQVKQLQQGGGRPFIVKYTWALIFGGIVIVLLIVFGSVRRKHCS